MKRLVAVSDSHGMTSNLRDVVQMALERGKVDCFVFLGDGIQDLDGVRPLLLRQNPQVEIVAVRGNNDPGQSAPLAAVFYVNGLKVMATHGHQQHVKLGLDRLCYAAREQEAGLALYGHTHHSHLEEACGVLLVNPGAVCESSLHKAAFADIAVDAEGVMKAKLVSWAGTNM